MTVEDKIAEAYERGHFVATQRAISRQELGLPLEYGKTGREPYLKPLIDGWQTADRALGHPTAAD